MTGAGPPPTAGSGALHSTKRDVTLQLTQPQGTDSRQRRPKGKGSAAGKNRWLVDPNKLIKARPLSHEEEEKDEEEEEEEGGAGRCQRTIQRGEKKPTKT